MHDVCKIILALPQDSTEAPIYWTRTGVDGNEFVCACCWDENSDALLADGVADVAADPVERACYDCVCRMVCLHLCMSVSHPPQPLKD